MKPIRSVPPCSGRCVALVLLIAPAGFGQTLSGAPPGGSDATSIETDVSSSPRSVEVAGFTCTSDLGCDDASACTVDACVDGRCEHEPLAGCVSCEPVLRCGSMDLVFIVDTSGSMKDEAAALCSTLGQVVADLESTGAVVRTTVLGISETPATFFPCLTSDVVTLLGDPVPGTLDTCDFSSGLSRFESWGPATAIVAARFPWLLNAVRLVVPVSDEGPCNGNRPDGCNDPGDDRDSILNAGAVASAFGVTVSPITGSGTMACARSLADHLALATGGVSEHLSDPATDLPAAVLRSALRACPLDVRCDDGDFCTGGDSCREGVCAGEPIDGCKPCTASGFCSDGNACTDDVCVDFECITARNYDDSRFCCDPRTGALAPFEDGGECVVPVCDPATGVVTQTPKPDGTPCDDSVFCTDGDVCIAGECRSGGMRDCQAMDAPCLRGVCDEGRGACMSEPVDDGEFCDDGMFCTVDDVCRDGLCVGQTPRDCSEMDHACRRGLCFEDTARCEAVAVNDGRSCDDGVFCTVDERCDSGRCGGGVPRACDALSGACTVGVCDESAQQCVAQSANEGDRCDDALFCTASDTCAGGRCIGIAKDCSGLDGPCAVGVCSELLGRCEAEPINVDLLCDDGDSCTILDRCNAGGACEGRLVETVPCLDDEGCTGGVCNAATGHCVCSDAPELCLKPMRGSVPVDGCYRLDELVRLDVVLHPSLRTVAGGQFLIDYDADVFEVVGIDPGQWVDATSPFLLELSEEVDAEAGTIFYAIGIALGGEGTMGPAVMATVWLRPLAACAQAAGFCFSNRQPLNTVLTDVDGQFVPFRPCCSEALTIDGAVPTINCPQNVRVNADAARVTATVTWEPLTATDGCGGVGHPRCSAWNDLGALVDPLTDTGGLFPAGLTTFQCTVADDCGVATVCEWRVEVLPFNTIELDLQLSPTVEAGPVQRCVELRFYDEFVDCESPAVDVLRTFTFGLPFDLPGRSSRVLIEVPAGDYSCATARDPLHTLRSVTDLEIVNGVYHARFVGDPARGGNWLVGGDLNGDGAVDGLDFDLFLTLDGQPANQNTNCATPAPHGDINGDGMVDFLDLAFIEDHMSLRDTFGCCDGGVKSAPATLDAAALQRRDAHGNGDGRFGGDDVGAYPAGRGTAGHTDASRRGHGEGVKR